MCRTHDPTADQKPPEWHTATISRLRPPRRHVAITTNTVLSTQPSDVVAPGSRHRLRTRHSARAPISPSILWSALETQDKNFYLRHHDCDSSPQMHPIVSKRVLWYRGSRRNLFSGVRAASIDLTIAAVVCMHADRRFRPTAPGTSSRLRVTAWTRVDWARRRSCDVPIPAPGARKSPAAS